MVDNFAESANIQALFHGTELTGVEEDKNRYFRFILSGQLPDDEKNPAQRN